MRIKYRPKNLMGALLFAFVLALRGSCSPAKDDSPGWIIDQYCESLGATKIYLTDKAIKILQNPLNITIVCRARSGKVCQYNSRTRRQLICDAQNYSPINTGLAALSMGVKFANIPMERKGESAVLKMPTAVFCYGQSNRRLPDKARLSRNMALEGLQTAEYQITQSFKVPKILANIQARFYGLPELDGVPLELTYSDVEGRKPSYLCTLSCRRTTLKDEEFAMPTGYKSVASQTELTVQKSEAGNISDILNMTKGK